MANEKTKEEIYYELMPHKKIKNIKKEIENLKKKAEKESFTSKNFMGSVNSLTNSIDSLMELFKDATESMRLEEQAEEEAKRCGIHMITIRIGWSTGTRMSSGAPIPL